uniref:Uncharacterized protein n=1 Tax=Pararge aegeria TaxID=116150 RepID=S4NZ12_9NEOP
MYALGKKKKNILLLLFASCNCGNFRKDCIVNEMVNHSLLNNIQKIYEMLLGKTFNLNKAQHRCLFFRK